MSEAATWRIHCLRCSHRRLLLAGNEATSVSSQIAASLVARSTAGIDDPGGGVSAGAAGASNICSLSLLNATRGELLRVQELSNPMPPASMSGGRKGVLEANKRATSVAAACDAAASDAGTDLADVLEPDDPFVTDPYPSSQYIDGSITGASWAPVYDEGGELVQWPWETIRHTGGKRRRHRAFDSTIRRGLFASSASGAMGANTTGVRRWKIFTASEGTTPARPMDSTAPLRAKLDEEWLCMRFLAWLIEDGGVQVNTAAGYFGQVQGWHAKEYGVKLAAGIKLNRLPAMLKGLRRVMDDGGRAVRRGFAPQALRRAMDKVLDPNDIEHANIRAALSLALQGLLRGAEFTVDGIFDAALDLTRADVASLSAERLVLMMRPCKNMHHLRGKTVPLIIGAGGEFIDAVAEMRNLFKIDPVDKMSASTTPLFRLGREPRSRRPLTTRSVRDWTRVLAVTAGENPEQFGAHSYRIGGATALFAAGADPVVIRTMGRWSSDIYRLYVRACFSETIKWSRKAGSQQVHDVASEFAEVDSY